MNMQKNKRKFRLSLLILVLISSIFIITSSDSSMAWETFKADYWQTGNMFQDVGGFDEGYQYIEIGVGGTFVPLAFENPDVSNKTIVVVATSTNLLYAFHEDSGTITTIDTISSGTLMGQLAGFDKELNDNKFEVAGIFDVSGIDYFRVFDFNGTDWSLMYNFTTLSLNTTGDNAGVTCREYNGVDYCVFVDGNGSLYEVNIDTLSYTAYGGLGTLTGAYAIPIRNPIVESLRGDGTYQAIFHTNYDYDGGHSKDIVSWDLTLNQLDTDFGGGDGVITDAMDGAPFNIVIAQVGVSCSWFLGLFPYDCQGGGDLEIFGWSGFFTNMNAYLWDSSGSELDKASFSLSNLRAGDVGVMDCNDDGILDLVAQVVYRNGLERCQSVYCFDGKTLDTIVVSGIQSGANEQGCQQGTGIALADLNRDGDVDIATGSGAFDFLGDTATLFVHNFGAQAPAIADFDGDSFLDVIYTKAGTTRIYMSNATNQNPQFIGDGTEVDTCVPLCINATITFYARQDLDYSDDEGDNAYLGVNCYGLGFENVTWSSLATDPEISCTYNSLGYWNVPVYITDLANFPSYSETQSFGIYTSLGASCYDTGEWQEECDPVTEVDEIDECFTDSGISVCLVSGTSSALCEECDCYSVSGHRCPLIINGTVADTYVAVMFDWDECVDWKGSMWYGACPLFVWTTSLLGKIWDWIFGAFWIFLTLILVMVIALLIFKKVRK